MKPSKTLRFALLFTTITALILTGVAFAFSIGGTRSMRLPFRSIVHRTALGRSLRPVISHTSLVSKQSVRSIATAIVKPVRLASVKFDAATGGGLRHGTAVGLGDSAKSNAVTSTVSLSEAVRTFDLFAPAPSFLPIFGPPTTLAQLNAADIGVTGLVSSNTTPTYTSDGQFILFAANLSPDGRTHIWESPASGKTLPVQITSGTGNEFFPRLSAGDAQLAFTSDAQSAGTQNLYVMNFTQNPTTPTNLASLSSLTIRGDVTTGFGNVSSPTWSPAGDRIAFSARNLSTNHYHIYFLFTATNGYLSSGVATPPAALTSGPTDETGPAWSPDGAYIAFSSDAATITDNSNPAISPTNAPSVTTSAGSNALRRIWTIGGGKVSSLGTGAFPITNGLSDDLEPTWAPFGTNSAFAGDIAFSRGASISAPHQIFYIQSLSNVATDTEQTEGFGTTAAAVLLNTDNNSAQYNDEFPTWEPAATLVASEVARIAYDSNRSVTYNNPTTGAPSETAINIPQGTAGVGASYTGILESELATLTPPALLQFNSNEIVHVNQGATTILPSSGDATGAAIRVAAPKQSVTFTVRLSDREAGVDNANVGNGGLPRVFVQIKDPESAFQDLAGREHKVFTRDLQTWQNQQAIAGQVTSGSEVGLYNGGTPDFTQTVNNVGEDWRGTPAGVVGGTPINVGRDGGGINQVSNPGTGFQFDVAQLNLQGDHALTGNPTLFNVTGQEYECQAVNPKHPQADTLDTDYSNPFFLAGVDDQVPNTGTSPEQATQWLQLTKNPVQDTNGGVLYTGTWVSPQTPSDFYLDVIVFDTQNNWRIYDNVWGYTTQPWSPSSNVLVVNDNALGQKFTLTSFGPNSGFSNLTPVMYGAESYFTDISKNYLPNAVYYWGEAFGYVTNPVVSNKTPKPGATPTDLTAFSGLDSITLVWTPIAGGDNTTLYNIFRGTQAGAEGGPIATVTGTTFTDSTVAVTTPPTTYFYYVTAGPLGAQTAKSNEASAIPSNPIDTGELAPQVQDLDPTTFHGGDTVPHNTLGTFSFPDQIQTYDIWRILSRGPVDATLNSYLDQPVSQPAVNDGTLSVAADSSVPVATKCVIWLAPFAGRLLEGAGSIDSPTTQSDVAAFVNGGGRLFLDGNAIPDALTNNGASTSTFLGTTLSSNYVNSDGGSQNLAGAGTIGSRISNDAYFNVNTGLGADQFFDSILTTNDSDSVLTWDNHVAPYQSGLFLGNNYYIFPGPAKNPANVPIWRTDGSLDQLGSQLSTFGLNLNDVIARMPVISAVTGAHVDFSYNAPGADFTTGGSALVYNELTTGGRTIFAAAGLESLGLEYYQLTSANRTHYFTHDQRPRVMHNVIEYLRTGKLTGTILSTTGTSAPQDLPGATVYITPTPSGGVTTIPGNGRGLYSATTDGTGSFTITGIEAGNYTVHAYAPGYTDAVSNTTFNIDADHNPTVSLQVIQLASGTITGTVKDQNGNGVIGASVSYTSETGGHTVGATTTAGGVYTISGVPAAVSPGLAYDGTATANGSVSAVSVPDPVLVISGASAIGNFTLTVPNGTVGGEVKDSSTTNPILGASVTITPTGTGTTGTTVTTVAPTTPPIGPNGDGAAINYSKSVIAGSYTVTAAASGYQTATKSVTVPSNGFIRADFPLVKVVASQTGTLTGLVTDTATPANIIAGATVTVTDPAHGGAVVASTTTTSASGTNYTISGIPAGSYDVTVSDALYTTSTPALEVITAGGTTVYNVQLSPVPPIHTIPAGTVAFFSTPYNYAGVSLDTLFGPLNTSTTSTPNGTRSDVKYYRPSPFLDYVTVTALDIRFGYWIKAYETINIPSGQGTRPTGTSVSIPLQSGWNSIGVPSLSAVSVSSLTVQPSAGGTPISFDQAASATFSIIYGTMYGYNGTAYTPVISGSSGGATNTLQPWQGYWIYAYQPCTLIVPTGN